MAPSNLLSSILLYFFFFFVFSSSSLHVHSKLTVGYYQKNCPDFEKIVRETVTSKQITSPVTAAGTLRLFFHDCMVDGCDASVLISSNSFNKAEREADINQSLSGDAFDVVVHAKTTLELVCPGVVSCSDILAQATRDLIVMVGGPFYNVRLGRKDALTSKIADVEGNIPRVNHTIDDLITIFGDKGFTVQEIVALSGGHTIGFSHCKEFSDRLFKFSTTTPTDPDIYPKFAEKLKVMCANLNTDSAMSAFNDVMTPGKFDNMYYQNLGRGLGLLATDHALVKDHRTKPFVDLYAVNQTAFFHDFSHAMEKLSVYGVKTGRKGEVRRRCDHFNAINT